MQAASRIRILDKFGRHAYDADEDHAKGLIRKGYGIGLGTKQRIRCVRLTVPLSEAEGGYAPMKAETLSQAIGRTRYVFREHVGERWWIYQHTRLSRKLHKDFVAVLSSVLSGAEAAS